MPRRPQLPEECSNCNRLSDHLIRGRCNTCYSYWRKHGHTERPLHSRNGEAGVWEAVGPGEVAEPCECGNPVAWRLVLPAAERGRMTLYLCEACEALEKSLSPTSSWGD